MQRAASVHVTPEYPPTMVELDSGPSAAAPIVYTAFPGESVTLSAGQRLAGLQFRQWKGNILVAKVPLVPSLRRQPHCNVCLRLNAIIVPRA